ncbi:unnamed protein product [Phytophthora lilii]|uniref:Unnamed protein product n=1 Tax=Phytophthora lilii TaxID=2077276 RepID=A0A9W6UEW9_9STRA|nr:unnamed protein product [Phytophthora lilii]
MTITLRGLAFGCSETSGGLPCDANPGSGMNPYKGRGAPEIDILEGGGTEISSSIQVGPGMHDDFRMLQDNESYFCIYSYSCTTIGANNQDVPTAYYNKLRGHKSCSWESKPPNAGVAGCYGDGTDEKTNAICDSFPMKMKIDYVRVYQDTSSMVYGCDPASHPTMQWIEDHIDLYEDFDNLVVEVSGKASCNTDADCTISTQGASSVRTGYCTDGRCECTSHAWTGPRFTETTSIGKDNDLYGPPLLLLIAVAVVAIVVTFGTILYSNGKDKLEKERALQKPRCQNGASEASRSYYNCTTYKSRQREEWLQHKLCVNKLDVVLRSRN